MIEFDDGGVIRGKIPSGIMTGIVIGDNMFHPKGATYSYDPLNHIVSSYDVLEKDTMKGYIGKLTPKAYEEFIKCMDNHR